ncbi:hypothetical protein BBO99_00004853 [Phytophthora kernoviae]|uniref:Uncharacterized protein n=2 Tax=Phytophthora kernoviae TaxID=325452 RepID=A0A3R7GIT9_9STRA|nr:hypothetical protein G195_005313 [Phytophthora kernoviae 00238/432]KAG2519929.1 hypothetical protein JM16_004667 [Phytophthora kernoviae]KAG2526797.1 hypothetical protein JM18_004188 [Phytophthora kernoviae]RLN06248.1 hypothetical protein BBI17_004837 [Phytophthora kernoviae]RLN80001.1 hypothetical protein BBO99_00004853 [Phytophthora kernoviae]
MEERSRGDDFNVLNVKLNLLIKYHTQMGEEISASPFHQLARHSDHLLDSEEEKAEISQRIMGFLREFSVEAKTDKVPCEEELLEETSASGQEKLDNELSEARAAAEKAAKKCVNRAHENMLVPTARLQVYVEMIVCLGVAAVIYWFMSLGEQ